MSDLSEIKKRIYNEDKIKYLLEQLKCVDIKSEQNNNLITAGLPDKFESDNKRTVQIKNNEKLTSYIRSKGISGDIFNIVAYIKNYTLPEDIRYVKDIVCNMMGYSSNNKSVKVQKDWLEFLHKIKKQRKKDFIIDTNEKILPSTILNQYINRPVKEWWLEGLKGITQQEFEIGMDISFGVEKIIFPLRDENNNIVSIKARVLYKYEKYPKYKDMKYFYLYPYDRKLHLYNYYKAYSYIKKYNKVYVFEGAKTVMYAWQYGVKNAVSTEGDEITEQQIYKLKKLECEIIFVFDKDIELDFFNKYKQLLINRLSYIIIDNDDLLGEQKLIDNKKVNKNSPTDKGKEIFLKLINNKKYWNRI